MKNKILFSSFILVIIIGCHKTAEPTCSDGIKNQHEVGIDCGGECAVCSAIATCTDGIKNQGETGIDCGGPCDPCLIAMPNIDTLMGDYIVSGVCYNFHVPSTYDTTIFTNDTIQVLKINTAQIKVEGVILSYNSTNQNGSSSSFFFNYSNFPYSSWSVRLVTPDSLYLSSSYFSTPSHKNCWKKGTRIH